VPSTPRDLETVCLKCLEKEPAKRYPSARALAEDLRRFQAKKPILARRAGYFERAVKWGRRNPASTLAIAFAALGLGSAIAGLVWHNRQLQRAVDRAELGEAEAREQKAQALAAFQLSQDTLEETILNLIQAVGGNDDSHTRAVRQEEAALALHYYDQALRHCLADDPDYRFLRAKTLACSAYLETVLDRHPAAFERYRQAITLFEGLIAEAPDRPEYRRELGFCASRFGYSLLESGSLDDAERQLNRARDLLVHLPQPDSDPGRTQWLLGFCYQRLTQLYDWKNDMPRAAENARLGTEAWRGLVGHDPNSVKYRVQLADMIRLAGSVTSRRDGPPANLAAARDVIVVLARFQDVRGVDWGSVRARYYLGDAYMRSATVELITQQLDEARADATRGIRVINSLLNDHPGYGDGRVCLYALHRCRALATPSPGAALADWDDALTASTLIFTNGCRIERTRAYVAAGKHAYIGDECAALSRDPKVSADQLFTLAVCFAECFASLDRPAITADSEEGERREKYFVMSLECLKRCQAADGFRAASRVAELKDLPVFGGLRTRPVFRDWLVQLDASRSSKP
jgi:hypothetical protein